jgi:PII-like signaling protein
VIEQGLRLTAYIGERERAGGRLLADALIDAYARHGVRTSALLRGVEGFGIKQRLRTDRLLTLSEDLPLVALAVDTRERVQRLAAEVRTIARHGVIMLERARLLTAPLHDGDLPADEEEVKLTVYLARQQRVGGVPAHVAVVACLHDHGVAGATALLGVDGTADGVRRRARLLARNAHVPAMVQSVGRGDAIARALRALTAQLSPGAITLERARVCKRDGELLAPPAAAPPVGADGLAYWQKLVVYNGEQARHGHRSVHGALVSTLREQGAAGATVLRGQWGYHGERAPHGERFWSLRRHAPVLTVVLDTPANTARWFRVVDELTAHTGLVTAELVPALRAAAPALVRGGLRLAAPHTPVE